MGSNPTKSMDVFLLFCVVVCVVSGLSPVDPPSKESCGLCLGLGNWKVAKAQQRAMETIIIIIVKILNGIVMTQDFSSVRNASDLRYMVDRFYFRS